MPRKRRTLWANSSGLKIAFPEAWGGICKRQILGSDRRQVFAVGDGLGVDSMAMLILLKHWLMRPQVITFADVGDMTQNKPGEKPETYSYIPVVKKWLRDNNFPPLIVVHKKKVKAPDDSLYENCVRNRTLPSLAFGFKGCSDKWKIKVQEAYMKTLPAVQECWRAGFKVIKAIGYDAGPADIRRGSKPEDDRYVYWYPLREVGWDRQKCLEVIADEGLPGWNHDNEWTDRLVWVKKGGVPLKSACFFCPASKKWEIDRLYRTQRKLLNMAIEMEEIAKNDSEHPLGGYTGEGSTMGLGRSYAWGDYARQQGMSLPILKCELCDGGTCEAA